MMTEHQHQPRLDRLAPHVHFISGLMEARVKFVACDMPEATPFMLHIYASKQPSPTKSDNGIEQQIETERRREEDLRVLQQTAKRERDRQRALRT
jgi:hypothetical protein